MVDREPTDQILDANGWVLLEIPAEMTPLANELVEVLTWLRDNAFEPRVDWFNRITDHRLRIQFGRPAPGDVFGDVFVDARTGDQLGCRLFCGTDDPGQVFLSVDALRARIERHVEDRAAVWPIFWFTTRDVDGTFSDVVDSFEKVAEHAKRKGHQVLRMVYHYASTEPVHGFDFTARHRRPQLW